jgi:hypothetical protein
VGRIPRLPRDRAGRRRPQAGEAALKPRPAGTAYLRTLAAAAAAAWLASSCAGTRDRLVSELADPALPADPARTRLYQQPPARMVSAAREALAAHGYRVGETRRTGRGTWFSAGPAAGNQPAAPGAEPPRIGVIVRRAPGGQAFVGVVSLGADQPATVHVWIANALSSPTP